MCVCGCGLVDGRHLGHYHYVSCVFAGRITLSTGCSRGAVALVCSPRPQPQTMKSWQITVKDRIAVKVHNIEVCLPVTTILPRCSRGLPNQSTHARLVASLSNTDTSAQLFAGDIQETGTPVKGLNCFDI